MKKAILLTLLITFLGGMTTYSQQKPFVFGFKGGPTLGWMKPDAEHSVKEVTARILEELPKKAGVTYFAGKEDRSEEAKGPGVFRIACSAAVTTGWPVRTLPCTA